MKYYKIVGIIILVIVSSNCSPTLKLFTGIRDIRIESVESLKDFCLENNIDLENAYYHKSNELYTMPDSSQINSRYADQLLIFNKYGDRIIYQGEETGYYCPLPGSDFFSGLNSIFLPVDSSQNIKKLLNNFRNLESDNLVVIDTSDFYVVYYWAKWYRKFSKRSIAGIPNILSNANDTLSIQCFYLNNDFVETNYPDSIDFKKYKINLYL